jgi:hypothetical protein
MTLQNDGNPYNSDIQPGVPEGYVKFKKKENIIS